jgi:transposase
LSGSAVTPAATTYSLNAANEVCWADPTNYTGTDGCTTTPSGATDYTYDVDGNQTTGAGFTATYNALNQMTSATTGGTTTDDAYISTGNSYLTTDGEGVWNEPASSVNLIYPRKSGQGFLEFSGRGIHQMPQHVSPEVRRQVVELARAGTKVKQLAVTFGVSQQSVYNWLKQDRIDRGEAEGATTSQQLELAAAKRRIRQLETELAVARKVNEVFLNEGIAPKGSSR